MNFSKFYSLSLMISKANNIRSFNSNDDLFREEKNLLDFILISI